MKKKLFILTLFLLSFDSLFSQQTEEIINNLSDPAGIIFKGNDLYFTQANNGKVSKININQNTPIISDIVTGLSTPYSLAISGDILFICETGGQKISKIDLNSGASSKTDVIAGLGSPRDIIIDGNFLYITEYQSDKISKIDITASNPTTSDVLTGLSRPWALTIYQNELYFSELDSNGSKISKISLNNGNSTIENIFSSNSPTNRAADLIIDNNILYFSELNGGKISKINLSNNSLSDVTTQVVAPWGLSILNNELFFSDKNGNISKINISTLSIKKHSLKKIDFYPNPSTNIISFKGLNKVTKFKIFDISGNKILNGNITNNKKIDVSKFSNGVFFIILEDYQPIKFIKK